MKTPLMIVSVLLVGGCQLIKANPELEQPNSSPTPVEDKAAEDSTQELIELAFLEKHPDWDMSTQVVIIEEVTDQFARGRIEPKESLGGGGYFYAAMTTNGWVLAADGNGAIFCEQIEPYDFPVEMISQCYDDELGVVVER